MKEKRKVEKGKGKEKEKEELKRGWKSEMEIRSIGEREKDEEGMD